MIYSAIPTAQDALDGIKLIKFNTARVFAINSASMVR